MNNIFDNIPNQINNEIFDVLLQQHDFTIERIVSFGSESLSHDWFDQDTNEWVLVIQGYGILEFEDGTTNIMKAGDFEFIPAHIKHKVIEVDENQPTIWLAIHFK